MNVGEIVRETTYKIGRSATFKLFTICILILILLIPASMVERLIRERETRRHAVIDEITHKWGRAQTVVGPVISIPYKVSYEERDGKTSSVTRFFHLLPETLDIKSRIDPQIRYRGIYEAILYNTNLEISGQFTRLEMDSHIVPEHIMWSQAIVSLGITDMRGLQDSIEALFDGKPVTMNPGINAHDIFASGVSSVVGLEENKSAVSFRFALNLNGSLRVHFAPVGKVTTVSAQSAWKDPSFDGAFLPVDRTVTEKGFSAKWKVLHLNRNYPQSWTGSTHNIGPSTFGVTLYSPVDVYQKATRTTKYALLFIVFAFMAFFISEFLNRLRVHPVQYFLIGLGIVIFYSLLLSFSEHVGFGRAYLISAVAIVTLITTYARSILNSSRIALMAGGSLLLLYAYLYVLLQLVDFALLMGSAGLFGVLAAAMYLTRRIDWYRLANDALKKNPKQKPELGEAHANLSAPGV